MAALLVLLLIQAFSPQVPGAAAQARRFKYASQQGYLIVEFLDDDLVHLELSGQAPGPGVDDPIPTTPMIAKADYPGPSRLIDDGEGTLETPEMRVQVNEKTLCTTLTDLTANPPLTLTTLCPRDLDRDQKGISLTPESFTHAYGLGQQFITPQSSEGDWVGRVRTPGSKMGNAVIKELGAKGYTLYPIHPDADTVDGVKSYRTFADLPERVDAAFIAVAPAKTRAAVQQAHEAGVSRVWIQQGAHSPEADEYCATNGIEAVSRECILMFAEPVESIHKFHRFFKKLFGGMPK